MKKILLSLFSLSAFTALAQPARVQLINNSPDSTYPVMDVYRNGMMWIDNMMFRDASQFIPLPSNQPVTFSFAPENSTSVNDTFYSTTMVLTPGSHILMLNGTKGQTGYTPPKRMQLYNYPNAKESATPSNTELLFANGSTDIGVFDLRSGLNVLVNDLAYGGFSTSYMSMPSHTHIPVRLTNMSGSKTNSTYDLNLMPFSGQAGVVFASGFDNPGANKNGQPFSLFIALANGMVMELGKRGPEDIARIQFIHNSADAKAVTVDVYFNDSLAFNNVSFRTASPFMDAIANMPLIVGIAPSNSSSVSDTFFSTELVIDPVKTYIAVLDGIKSTSGYSPAKPMDISMYDMAMEEGTNPVMTDILFVQGSTDAPVFDLRNEGNSNAVVVNDAAYGSFTNIQLQPAPYVIRLTDAAGTQLYHRYDATLTGSGGQAITVLTSGFWDSTQNSNGRKLGLFVVSPAGGPFLQVPELPVSVKEIDKHSIIKIYPNPATSFLSIEGLGNSAFITIYDVMGRKVLTATNLQEPVDISKLNSGLHFMKIEDEGHAYSYRFIKQ